MHKLVTDRVLVMGIETPAPKIETQPNDQYDDLHLYAPRIKLTTRSTYSYFLSSISPPLFSVAEVHIFCVANSRAVWLKVRAVELWRSIASVEEGSASKQSRLSFARNNFFFSRPPLQHPGNPRICIPR
jgi:hypothetical protein